MGRQAHCKVKRVGGGMFFCGFAEGTHPFARRALPPARWHSATYRSQPPAATAASNRSRLGTSSSEARALAPNDPETAFALGSGYLQAGKISDAERLFDEVAAARPIPQTHVLIGRTFRDFQEYELARQSLTRALEMDSGVRRARYYLGTIELFSLGRDGLEAAVPLFEAELQRFPDDPMANLYLGLALAENRRFEEALEPLRLAAAWSPSQVAKKATSALSRMCSNSSRGSIGSSFPPRRDAARRRPASIPQGRR